MTTNLRMPRLVGTTWINLWLLLAFFLLVGASLTAWNQVTMLSFARANLSTLCDATRDAYRTGGAQQMSSVGPGDRTMPRIHLVDSTGKDLVDGTDRRALLSDSRGSFPFGPPGAIVLAASEGISCILEAPPPRPGPGVPAGIWSLPLICLLCFSVAVYVNRRSRRLETALADFGSGQLDARISWKSSDPLGRLSNKFNEMADRIESLVHAQQRLCVDLSHELRSPLARLILATRLVREGRMSALDTVERETVRLDELLGELLEVARAEADPTTIESEILEIRPFVEEVASQCEIEARNKGCSIEIACNSPGAVEADRELLRRALENVFRNAIRYSPPDTAIITTLWGTEKDLTIQVRDVGPGIPEESLSRIFDAFYRVNLDRNRQTGGTGLGLAITKRAVSLHGGSVRASNESPGLMVEIQLPRSIHPAATRQAQQANAG